MTRESVTLYFREGTSDKVYQTAIEEKDGGFVVSFAYGRRGSTLQTGTKTAAPVDFQTAKKVYDKLIAEKTGKGYTPGADGTPYAHTDNEQRDTGLRCQLLNPIDEAQAEKLLDNPAWWLQEKYDGRRVLVRKDASGTVTGINRKGLTIGLPEPVIQHAKLLPGTFVIDGECIGDKLFVFDCLEREGIEVAGFPYSKRLQILMGFVGKGAIDCAPTSAGPGDKHDLFQLLKEANREGVVFKRHDAPYTAGRPASGGTQVKFKFVTTSSFIVAKVNAGKRSVAITALDRTRHVAVGNVTIPPNAPIPAAGAIVEVRYLYAYPGGSLYQPVYIGLRDDIDTGACTVEQLKYRAVAEEDDA
ncbi:MAG: WGR domain-containing protein [Planctomycetota bacterium]